MRSANGVVRAPLRDHQASGTGKDGGTVGKVTPDLRPPPRARPQPSWALRKLSLRGSPMTWMAWTSAELAEAFAYLALTIFTAYFLNYAQTPNDLASTHNAVAVGANGTDANGTE